MFTIIGGDGKEYGPVPAAKIAEWIAGGRANLQTKARRAGEAEFHMLGEFPEFGGAAAAASSVPPPVSGGVPVAYSVPTAAAPVTPQGTPAEIAAAMLARSAGLDLGRCISRAFDLWKAHLLPLVGVTLLSLIIQTVIGMIPVVSLANTFFLSGVFTGGLYYYYLGKMRGQPRTVGDIFAGFSQALGRLGLTNLIFICLMMAIMLPFFAPFFIAIFKLALANQGSAGMPQFPAMSIGMMALAGLGIFPLMYFSVSWMFAYALAMDQGLGPWTALEVSRRVITRHWFPMFGLLIIACILMMLGLIGLIIGVVFTIPIGIAIILYAYEDLCCAPAIAPAPAGSVASQTNVGPV